ncbi:MAG: NAD-dependent deacylase [Thermoanaerobacteraceae bacterium]|nr:NAD-dependent deacylase [Thermoanaerobacteraceae bacterium]
MDYQQRLTRAKKLLEQSKRVFALTGAGISTESGIPDYRSPGTGLWEKVNPLKTASASALRNDPAEFYRTTIAQWREFSKAEPNAGHYALKELEENGYILGIITQNIDGLHLKAGSQSVLEVHGHLRTARCMQCENRVLFEEITRQLDAGTNPPRCAKCSGVLRPDVVLFEDPMSEDFLKASKVLSGCDLLLVIGTSLQVYPVATLPQLAKRLIIINKMPTPYDNQAELIFRESIGQVLTDLKNLCLVD